MTDFYRKKPVVIEAIEVTEENDNEVKEFLGDSFLNYFKGVFTGISFHPPEIEFKTIDGSDMVSPGDFIVKSPDDFYAWSSDRFEKNFEKVESDD